MQTVLILRAEAICLIILLYLFCNNLLFRKQRVGNNFIWLCAFALGHVGFDFVTVYMVNHLSTVPDWLNHAAHLLFYLFGALFGLEFGRYAMTLIYPTHPVAGKKLAWGYGLFSVVYLVIFSFIPIEYVEGEGTWYSSGPAALTGFMIPLVCFVVVTIWILCKRRALDLQVTWALLPMLALLFLCVVTECWRTELLFTGGCVTLVTIGVYFALENPLLLRALHKAKAAEQAKSLFLASMSHEIRTPLNAIIGFADLLKEQNIEPEKEREYLAGIASAGNSLLALINDVLDLSKLEADKMLFSPTPVKFVKLVTEMQLIFRQKCDEKGVEFIADVPDNLPRVLLDKLRLRQILFNLVGNAVKFTQKGMITVKARFVPNGNGDGRGDFTIEVLDTGIGIAKEEQATLFGLYMQSTALLRTRKPETGTGLGLALVKRLIEHMHGTVTVQSTPGVGTSFELKFPDVASREQDSMPDSSILDIKVDFPMWSVLVVDDVPMNLKVVTAILKSLGLSPDTASSAKAALHMLSQKNYDLVFTDLWMPELNGAELAAKIRQSGRYPDLKIIAITADVDSGSSFDMQYFDATMSKPVSVEKFREALSHF